MSGAIEVQHEIQFNMQINYSNAGAAYIANPGPAEFDYFRPQPVYRPCGEARAVTRALAVKDASKAPSASLSLHAPLLFTHTAEVDRQGVVGHMSENCVNLIDIDMRHS